MCTWCRGKFKCHTESFISWNWQLYFKMCDTSCLYAKHITVHVSFTGYNESKQIIYMCSAWSVMNSNSVGRELVRVFHLYTNGGKQQLLVGNRISLDSGLSDWVRSSVCGCLYWTDPCERKILLYWREILFFYAKFACRNEKCVCRVELTMMVLYQ